LPALVPIVFPEPQLPAPSLIRSVGLSVIVLSIRRLSSDPALMSTPSSPLFWTVLLRILTSSLLLMKIPVAASVSPPGIVLWCELLLATWMMPLAPEFSMMIPWWLRKVALLTTFRASPPGVGNAADVDADVAEAADCPIVAHDNRPTVEDVDPVLRSVIGIAAGVADDNVVDGAGVDVLDVDLRGIGPLGWVLARSLDHEVIERHPAAVDPERRAVVAPCVDRRPAAHAAKSDPLVDHDRLPWIRSVSPLCA